MCKVQSPRKFFYEAFLLKILNSQTRSHFRARAWFNVIAQ